MQRVLRISRGIDCSLDDKRWCLSIGKVAFVARLQLGDETVPK